MAILKHMVAQKVISGLRGVIDYYYYMGIPCARSWPSKPAVDRNPNVRAQWPIFSNAAKLWSQVSPVVRQACEEMAVGTNLTDKDIFTRGYISGTLKFYQPPDELEET